MIPGTESSGRKEGGPSTHYLARIMRAVHDCVTKGSQQIVGFTSSASGRNTAERSDMRIGQLPKTERKGDGRLSHCLLLQWPGYLRQAERDIAASSGEAEPCSEEARILWLHRQGAVWMAERVLPVKFRKGTTSAPHSCNSNIWRQGFEEEFTG